ncbi:hypothetical protein DPMN_183117 [Dreissena polymorpha]|uniref:Uncharacterized protein n=1 Tax=Dreissena polymorpha TaxID=45954 RepID=A0A9D4DJE5_DREPO|nr:hypothetical protein DPMN_183117 [Dreissena polymorpha]
MYLMELHILSGERSSSFKVRAKDTVDSRIVQNPGNVHNRFDKIMKLHRFIDHDSQMTPIDFQVTRYIDHDSQMTLIDFEVTRSKVKVTHNSKMVSG